LSPHNSQAKEGLARAEIGMTAYRTFELANENLEKRNYTIAISQYREILKQFPNYRGAQNNLNTAWAKRNEENPNKIPSILFGTWEHVTPARQEILIQGYYRKESRSEYYTIPGESGRRTRDVWYDVWVPPVYSNSPEIRLTIQISANMINVYNGTTRLNEITSQNFYYAGNTIEFLNGQVLQIQLTNNQIIYIGLVFIKK